MGTDLLDSTPLLDAKAFEESSVLVPVHGALRVAGVDARTTAQPFSCLISQSFGALKNPRPQGNVAATQRWLKTRQRVGEH